MELLKGLEVNLLRELAKPKNKRLQVSVWLSTFKFWKEGTLATLSG